MVSSAELQLINDNSQPENEKDASGGDSPKVSPSSHLSVHLWPRTVVCTAVGWRLLTDFSSVRGSPGRLQASLLLCTADRAGHHAGHGQAAHTQRNLQSHHKELPVLPHSRQGLAGMAPFRYYGVATVCAESRLVWIKNPQSVQAETETRPSRNALYSETLKKWSRHGEQSATLEAGR